MSDDDATKLFAPFALLRFLIVTVVVIDADATYLHLRARIDDGGGDDGDGGDDDRLHCWRSHVVK